MKKYKLIKNHKLIKKYEVIVKGKVIKNKIQKKIFSFNLQKSQRLL